MAPWLAAEAMPDQVLGRVLDVGDVPERPRAGHDDVGAQRQREHRVSSDRRAARHDDVPPNGAEVDQLEHQLGPAGRDVLESIGADAIRRGRGDRGAVDPQIDGHAWQNPARFVQQPTADVPGALSEREGGHEPDRSAEECESA